MNAREQATAARIDIDAAHAARLRSVFERTPKIDRVWVFGSRARGEGRPESDIDLVVDAPEMSDREFALLLAALDDLPLLQKVDTLHWQRVGDAALRGEIEADRRVFWAPRRGHVDEDAFGAVELKPFQRSVLMRWRQYLERLKKFEAVARQQEAQLAAMDDAVDLLRQARNFPKKTWDDLRRERLLPPAYADHPYRERWTDEGNAARAIPNVCLKVPTGGGKTLMAAAAVARALGTYYRRHTGLVLWIVPNEAIYRQTRKALTDTDHPYRQILNVAAAGRVKVLEKHSPLSRLDVESNLVVMLLMLQSAARQSKETLRMFRDRGDVHGFFPREDDMESHWAVLQQVPNLDVYAPLGQSMESARRQRGSIVKDSLGNVLRALRPLVVIDEGQHTYTETALATIDGLNPSLVLELSATPRIADKKNPNGSNLLVDVHGTDLEAAEMIKLPINVDVRPWSDWKSCLTAAVEKQRVLDQDAQQLSAETLRYIRPILLVQVERTGKDQRDLGFIHADDARAHLKQLGFADAEIAEKTSEKDELSQPENMDLLSPANRVRAIITKQALQEGWDCPFAYVLCALAAGRQPAALTQLIGRILRQPHTAKTPLATLNESYVYCNDAKTGDVVNAVKKSLEVEGMGDLTGGVRIDDPTKTPQLVTRRRPPALAHLRIFLPRVTFDDGAGRRELAYEADILSGIDWSQIDATALLGEWAPDANAPRESVLRVGLEVLGTQQATVAPTPIESHAMLDRARIVRALTDIVPNPWIVWDAVQSCLGQLAARGHDESQIARSSATLIEALRAGTGRERDRLAQLHFNTLVAAGRIRFALQADAIDYELPYEITEDAGAKPKAFLCNRLHAPTKALLAPVFESSFDSSLEGQFACYLDSQAALRWWHRNVARTQYGLQGWRRDKVYPDFVFARADRDGRETVVVMETKGLHLKGADDTDYKRELLARLSELYSDDRLQRAGELALVDATGVRLVCDLVFDEAWRGVLAARHFGADAATHAQ